MKHMLIDCVESNSSEIIRNIDDKNLVITYLLIY